MAEHDAPGHEPNHDDPRAFAAELAADLRGWLEWVALTGGDEVPVSLSSDIGRDIPRNTPRDIAAPLAPRSPSQRLASAPMPARPGTPPGASTSSTTPAQRVTPRVASSAHPVPPPPTSPVSAGNAGLQEVRAELGDCQRCRLGSGRKNLVFGVGNPEADLVLIGEAPGQQEDLTGEPFVGRAGQLLTRMLAAIGLPREAVYICNVIKCRPPQNRDPLPDEIATCSPFLFRQLSAIQPKVLLTVGRFAASALLGVSGNMGELRKHQGSWNGVPIVSTYHPSYLLRTPHMKRATWEDLLIVRRHLREAGVGPQ